MAGWPLKPGGVLLATAINRFTSLLSGLANGFIDDAPFVSILRCDLGRSRQTASAYSVKVVLIPATRKAIPLHR